MSNIEFYDPNTYSSDADYLMRSLKEKESLEKWQSRVCRTVKVFSCFADNNGNLLTQPAGKKDEAERLLQIVDMDQLQTMIHRVCESTLEDQAIEETAYPNLRLAVVTARAFGKPVLNWLIFGVLSDYDTEGYEKAPLTGFTTTISEQSFSLIVDAVRAFALDMIRSQEAMLGAQAESRRSHFSAQELESTLKRTEALAQIIQLMESDDAIESIIQQFLQILGTYMHLSTASLSRLTKEQDEMDIVSHWCARGEVWPYESDSAQKRRFFLYQDKPFIVSDRATLRREEREDLESTNVLGLIAIPVMISGKVNMYAVFTEKKQVRVWQSEEIRFLADAVKILQSVLTRRIQKNSLASSYESLEKILDHVGSAVYVRNYESAIGLYANRLMRKSFAEEISGGTINQLIDHNIEGENGVGELYLENRDKWYEMYYTRMTWVDGRQVLLIALYDMTEKKVYQKKIEQQAHTDFLTGLYNRMCCERDLARYVDEAKKDHKKGALLYLDLDDFKHINDGLGHQYGDVLLKAIAHSFQKIAGIENTCYRMGGDEFVIIVAPDYYGELNRIVEDIKAIFRKPWFLKDSDYYCTMSMGIVDFPTRGEVVHDLVKKADIAMYESKKTGKNRVSFYTEESGSLSGKRLEMEKNMREATARGNDEFEVYFQPIVDVRSPEAPFCTGAEALIRWNSTELGFISPAEFIPLAEYLGLINPIGNYILQKACQCCSEWNRNGYPDYKVNVNLSVVQLLQSNIVDLVRKALDESGLKPQNLTLEVTESLAINDMERMKEILRQIKELGVRIALDDFGTGYSSLNHIRELPFDVIKVDQSFIRNLGRDVYAKSFVRMIAELAEAIDVNLCVEGVETKAQYDIISRMHVSMIQGYYFDRPLKQSEFEQKYMPLMGKDHGGK